MKSAAKVVRLLEKVRNGERCKEEEWDNKILPSVLNEIADKYDLKGTCNPEKPINDDMELADKFFEAGWEAALRLGFLCTDMERVVKISEEELADSMNKIPGSISVGKGDERVTIKAREPESEIEPIYNAPLSIQLDEEYYLPVTTGVLSSPLIDIQEGPSIDTVFGAPLLGGTPYESFAGVYEARLRKEAQWRAGRKGIGNLISAFSSTEYAFLSVFDQFEPPQIGLCLNPASLKVNYTTYHKLPKILDSGGYVRAESPLMMGGYTGGPETTAIASVATELLKYPVMNAHLCGSTTYDLRYSGNTGRMALWSQCMATQAVSRNTDILMNKIINMVSGPMTEMFFLEAIVGGVAASVSGQTSTIGPRSAGGTKKNHLTPLEAWYGSAIFKGAAGMSIDKANEIVNEIIPRYEDKLYDPPKGKSYAECFNVEDLTPKKEYYDLYSRMRDYAKELGIDIPNDGVLFTE